MSPAEHQLVRDTSEDFPVVLLEAEDETETHILREFLSAHGCEVVTRAVDKKPVRYHIVCGTYHFVNKIFSATSASSEKEFAIIYGGAPEDGYLFPDRKTKIVLIDPQPLTPGLARDIFEFFFTGKGKIHNSRKHHTFDMKQFRQPEQAKREEETPDETRVELLLNELYNKKKKQAPLPFLKPNLRVLAVGLAIFLPLLYLGLLGIGIGSYAASARLLVSGKVRLGATFLAMGNGGVAGARWLLGAASFVSPPSFFDGFVKNQERVLVFLRRIGETENRAIALFSLSQEGLAGFVSPKQTTTNPVPTVARMNALRSEVDAMYTELSLLQGDLDGLLRDRPFPISIGPLGKALVDFKRQASIVRQGVETANHLLGLYPHVAGVREGQEYLVLFQNSMELRPTGGFIGSLMAVRLVDGVIGEMKIEDVYVVDGQLRGHVDPPQAIRELLGQEHWYLRDSNWDPDFSESGRMAAWFYKKETDRDTSGVIGISLPLILRLLRFTGPIELVDYGDRISADNFFAKSVVYTNKDFFPGSTQKKDFLGSLATALLDRITHLKEDESIQLLRELMSGLASRDIQLYFQDQNLQALVTRYGWSGSLPTAETVCQGDGARCYPDFVSVVEANLGVNKANYFVSRNVLDTVSISAAGDVSRQLVLSYKNDAAVDAGITGGLYKVYTRVYLPNDARRIQVQVDNFTLPFRDTRKKEPSPLPYAELSAVSGESVAVGVAFEVQPQAERAIDVTYERGRPLFSEERDSTYRLFIRRQAGFMNTSWRTVLRYPIFWKVESLGGSAGGAIHEQNAFLAKDAQRTYNTTLERDATIALTFVKP